MIFNIEETDSEVLFKFKDKNMKEIASVLKPQTSGANISPFSSKNLPKKKYNYTEKQKNEYETIIKSIPKNKLLSLHTIMKNFVKDIITKRTGLSYENIKADMKKKKLSIKDYIYDLGFGEEFIIFLRKEVEKYK